MFGSIGWPEILTILVLALLVFGPRRLPELGRTLGRALSEFRRASSDLKRTLNAELALEDDERPKTPRRPELAEPPGPRVAPRTRAAPEAAPPDTTPRGAASGSDAEPAESLQPAVEPADEPATTH